MLRRVPVIFTVTPKYDADGSIIQAVVTYGWHDGGWITPRKEGLALRICLYMKMETALFSCAAGQGLTRDKRKIKRGEGFALEKMRAQSGCGMTLFPVADNFPFMPKNSLHLSVPCPPPFIPGGLPATKRPRLAESFP